MTGVIPLRVIREVFMSYRVFALTNDKARLCVHRLETSDEVAAEFVAHHWEECGFIVNREVEE